MQTLTSLKLAPFKVKTVGRFSRAFSKTGDGPTVISIKAI